MVALRRLFLFSMIFTGVFGNAFCMDRVSEEEESSDEYEMVDVAAQRREAFDKLSNELWLTIIGYEQSLNVTGKRALVSKYFSRLTDAFLFNEDDAQDTYGGRGLYCLVGRRDVLLKPNKGCNRSKYEKLMKVINNCSLVCRLNILSPKPIFFMLLNPEERPQLKNAPPLYTEIAQKLEDGMMSPEQAFDRVTAEGRESYDVIPTNYYGKLTLSLIILSYTAQAQGDTLPERGWMRRALTEDTSQCDFLTPNVATFRNPLAERYHTVTRGHLYHNRASLSGLVLDRSYIFGVESGSSEKIATLSGNNVFNPFTNE